MEKEGQEYSENDVELRYRDHSATVVSRRNLGDVHRGNDRSAPHTDPPDEAKEEERGPIPCERGSDRRDEVKDRNGKQGLAAAEAIGRTARGDCSDDRSDQRTGDGETEPEAAQSVDLLKSLRRARDDGRVESEQEAAESRNDRVPKDLAVELH